MSKFLSLLRTCLIIVSLKLVACGGAPEYPDINPKRVFPKLDKSFQCKLVTKDSLEIVCETTSTKFSEGDFEGNMCQPIKEVAEQLEWARVVIKKLNEKQKQLDRCQATINFLRGGRGNVTNE